MNLVQQMGVALLITIVYWIGFMVWRKMKEERNTDLAIKKEIEDIGLVYKE
tara:strand:- start:3820 stop:3972 length:153 start_codon:yes stop_codon:yes gene_type:complete